MAVSLLLPVSTNALHVRDDIHHLICAERASRRPYGNNRAGRTDGKKCVRHSTNEEGGGANDNGNQATGRTAQAHA